MIKLSAEEIRELCELDALCFPEPINYPYREMKHFVEQDGAMLLREREANRLMAFCLFNSRIGQVITIDVHPDYRRKGVGRRLLKEAVGAMKEKGCRRIYSNVALTNLASLRLHLRAGFKIGRIVPSYYVDGSSAYLLVMDLSDKNEKGR